MKIISEKTGKEYNSVELCLAAEKEYDERIAKEKAEKEAKEKALTVKKLLLPNAKKRHLR